MFTIIIVSLFSLVSITVYVTYLLTDRKNSCIKEAEVNRIIADVNAFSVDKPMQKKLRKIIKQINKSARNGRKEYYPTMSENIDIICNFSREELRKFFDKYGYKVVFKYPLISAGDIEKISWE